MLELRQTLLSAATTGSGVASLGRASNAGIWTFHITGSAGVGAGAVIIETAPTAAYAGTWAVLGGPVTVVASTTLSVHFESSARHVRARISTEVTGGTVTVVAEVNSHGG